MLEAAVEKVGKGTTGVVVSSKVKVAATVVVRVVSSSALALVSRGDARQAEKRAKNVTIEKSILSKLVTKKNHRKCLQVSR